MEPQRQHVQTYESTFEIAAPPERVWQVWSDVEHWPDWTSTVIAAELLGGATDLAIGVRVRIRQPRLRTTVWTVSDLVAGNRFTWTSTAPGLRSVASHEIATVGTGSLVTARVEQTGMLSGLVGRLIGPLVVRYLATEAAGLTEAVEG